MSGTIVTRTLAGGIAENNALNGVAPLSTIKDIVFTDEPILTVQADIESASLPASIIFTIPKTDIVFDSTGNGASSTLHIPIPTTKTGHIRAFVVRLEDDTIWGYAPYRPADDGLNKGNDIALTLLATITVSNEALTINYQPFDTQAIVDGMLPDFDLKYVEHDEALDTGEPQNVFIEKTGSKRQTFYDFVNHIFERLKTRAGFTYLGSNHTSDGSFTKHGLRLGLEKHTNFDGITYDDTTNEFEFYGHSISVLKVNSTDGIKLTKGFNGNNKKLTNIANATSDKDALNLITMLNYVNDNRFIESTNGVTKISYDQGVLCFDIGGERYFTNIRLHRGSSAPDIEVTYGMELIGNNWSLRPYASKFKESYFSSLPMFEYLKVTFDYGNGITNVSYHDLLVSSEHEINESHQYQIDVGSGVKLGFALYPTGYRFIDELSTGDSGSWGDNSAKVELVFRS